MVSNWCNSHERVIIIERNKENLSLALLVVRVYTVLFLSVVVKPDMREKLVMVHSVTPSSAEIQIQQLTLEDDSSKFYSYIIQYKETDEDFTNAFHVSHNQDIGYVQTTLKGLNPDTDYIVRVLPVRTHFVNNVSETGWPTQGVAFITG